MRLLLILGFLSAISLQAQYRVKPPPFKPTYYWGVTAGYNQINGFLIERNLKQKDGYPSTKSTLTFFAGLSSRHPKILVDPYKGKSRHVWINGIGIGTSINHYIDKIKRGWFWSFGVTGHLFFNNSIPSIYAFDQEPYYGTKKLKEFSAFGQFGHRFELEKIYITPQVGFGIMASPLRSSIHSKINEFYLHTGFSVSYRKNQ